MCIWKGIRAETNEAMNSNHGQKTVNEYRRSGQRWTKSWSLRHIWKDQVMKRIVREAVNTTLIVLGILSAGMGLKGFLMSSRFIDGGVTGISMLVSDVLGFPLSILILLINLPFVVVGYRQIGSRFALKSVLAEAADW